MDLTFLNESNIFRRKGCKEVRIGKMLTKITSKNQITIPKKIIDQLPDVQYFDLEVKEGIVLLKPLSSFMLLTPVPYEIAPIVKNKRPFAAA